MAQRCKILFFCNKDIRNPIAGGGTWELFRLMRMLVEQGHLVTLICGNYPGGRRKEVIKGIRVIRVGGVYTVFLYAMLRYLWSRKLKNYDVIVDVALMGVPFFTPLYTRKPVITIFWHLPRETFFIELMYKFGKVFGFIAAGIACFLEDKLAPAVYRDVPVFTFSKSTQMDLMKTGFRNVTMIEYALARAIMHGAICNHSIERKPFSPSKEKGGHPLLICLGRLKKYKGVQDVIKAMSLVVKDFPNAHLFIIGRGDYAPQLKILSKKLSLENNVHFLGYIPFKKKIEMYQKAHVLVMPSYKEGFATPVFEANMCGTVAVASSAIGVRESVKHRQTGFIYPVKDYRKMAYYLKLLIKDSKLRQKLEENARNWARRFEKLRENERKLLEKFEMKLATIRP